MFGWGRKKSEKGKGDNSEASVVGSVGKHVSAVANMAPDLVVFKALQLALGEILYIDRKDVSTDLMQGVISLTNVDIKPAGINKLLAGLNLSKPAPDFRLVTGFLELFEISGVFLSDVTAGKIDRPCKVTIGGLDLLFETNQPVEEPAEPNEEDGADVTPFLDSLLKNVSVALSKVHIRIQHDGKLAFGIVLGNEDYVSVQEQEPVEVHMHLALHKCIDIAIPAVYVDNDPMLIGEGFFEQEAKDATMSRLNPLSFLERRASAKKQNRDSQFVARMAEAGQKDRDNHELWIMAVGVCSHHTHPYRRRRPPAYD
jgi:hypothetical protein